MSSPFDAREVRISALLAESYEMVGHLGRGGFATVYRVRNRRLDRIEALKVLAADIEDPDFAERFRQEARLAASLDHANIIKIFAYGQHEDLCWFTMQFVDGPTLIRELKQKGPWSEVETAALAAAVCDALDYSHARGIVHRDIKPENILVDIRRHPYLMDFGIAKSEQSVVHTRTGTILGSPAYIAPEQLTGGAIDGRADIYSLGATLYRMVSNSFPFQDTDPVRMAMKRFTMAAEPLGPKRPGIHPIFESIVMKSLERDPAARFQTAGEMGQALKDFLAGNPVPLPPPDKFGRPPEHGGTPSGRSLPSGGTPSVLSATVGPFVELPAAAVLSASVPTIRTAPPAASAALPPLPARRRGRMWWIAAAIGLPALGAFLATRTSHVAPPVSAAPAAAPTVSSLRPTAPPATPPPAPTAAPEPTPGARVAAAASSPAERPRPVHPPPARPRADPSAAEPGAASSRRPAVPAQSESAPAIELSPELLREFANRSVGLRVTIAEDGTVKDARVISPVCPECDRAARAAILRYRFKPARDSEGRPVQSTVGVPVIIPGPENP
ncbi:MAG: protein kinase [Acidobacteria bacterium]|nr:protein kinase [Acidobacteriota bacterium]MCA1610924.1 protein kinase [Acidobacteriota bacterium]MCA1617353.1 protein kinase [Acidobacteriota bacterium]